MKHNAFTLAEVLITLLIIGVVAALTIPSVISNYQQQEFKTGLKKAVSVLNEAIQTNIALEGETPYENEDLFGYLKRHMSIISSQTGAGMETALYGFNTYFFTTDGMRFEFPMGAGGSSHVGSLTLHESNIELGSTSRWPLYAQYCGSYGLGANSNNTKYTPCVVAVDVNGDKKPNPTYVANEREEGRMDSVYTFPNINDKKINDLFLILITEEKAIPFGVVAQRAMYSK